MKIFVSGTRGIPYIPGGVEKHCQELYPRIASQGHEVILSTRITYLIEKRTAWRGVRFVNCYTPRRKSLETIVHTGISLIVARRFQADLVHIHGIGPALLTPIAKLLGMRVVVTNHGPDYNRQKWGRIAKWVLQLGEKCGAAFADQMIAISSLISQTVYQEYGRRCFLIPNGVNAPKKSNKVDFLDRIGAHAGNYVLAVARFVEEKGLHDLLEAFQRLQGPYQLVIAGDADHESRYSRRLKSTAESHERVILTGYITGEPLNQVYSHAKLFVLPSYHEGLPIALLEALSYGLSVLVSDIPANKEVGLPPSRYFRTGSTQDLTKKMKSLLERTESRDEVHAMQDMLNRKYNWDRIADQTIEVYRRVLENGNGKSIKALKPYKGSAIDNT